jgi:hypothetical protein
MRWFIKRLTAILIILLLLEVLAVFIGHQQPTPEYLSFLHLTDCKLPCWIGIEVGTTTLLEAKTQLFVVFSNNNKYSIAELEEPYPTFQVDDKIAGLSLIIEIKPEGGQEITDTSIIQSIELKVIAEEQSAYVGHPTLADLQGILGTPEYITIFYGGPLGVRPFIEHPNRISVDIEGYYTEPVCQRIGMNRVVRGITVLNEEIYPPSRYGPNYQPALWQGYGRCYALDQDLVQP